MLVLVFMVVCCTQCPPFQAPLPTAIPDQLLSGGPRPSSHQSTAEATLLCLLCWAAFQTDNTQLLDIR